MSLWYAPSYLSINLNGSLNSKVFRTSFKFASLGVLETYSSNWVSDNIWPVRLYILFSASENGSKRRLTKQHTDYKTVKHDSYKSETSIVFGLNISNAGMPNMRAKELTAIICNYTYRTSQNIRWTKHKGSSSSRHHNSARCQDWPLSIIKPGLWAAGSDSSSQYESTALLWRLTSTGPL